MYWTWDALGQPGGLIPSMPSPLAVALTETAKVASMQRAFPRKEPKGK